MTVAANTPYDQYNASNGQTVFNYTFEIVDNTDLLVYLTPVGTDPNDVTNVLVLNSQYTVTGAGQQNGGTITLVTPAALNDVITIKQGIPVERDTSFTPGGVLRAQDLNVEFDNQTLIQQLSRFNETSRMLSYWNSAIVVPLVDTIIPVLGANQIWAKNNDNDEIVVVDIPPDQSLAPGTSTYLIQTQDLSLPNAQIMGNLASGLVVNTATTGVQLSRVLAGTPFQIGIVNPSGLAGNPTFRIIDNPTLPGTAGMGIPSGTTAQRVTPTPPSIGLRFNTDLGQVEAYISAQWVAIPSAAAGLFLPLAGGTMSGAIDMDANFIHNLPTPVDPDDAATKDYVDNAVGGAAGGANTNMQYNDNGAFGGDPNFTTDGAGNVAIIGSFAMDNLRFNGNRISPFSGKVELESAQLFNALDANSVKIENLATPTVNTDAANKLYVDLTSQGKYFIDPVRVSATANFSATYNNGASGVGATLTATVNGAAAVDGVTLALNDRAIFPFQSSSFQNGIYTVTDLGSAGTPAVYTRATDYDEPSDIDPGDSVIVTQGTVYTGAGWMETAVVTTIGTDPITFTLFINPNVVTLNTAQTITGVKTFTGANNLGTPASGNLVNTTGYTVGALAGLGANVATFLATPSSANLAAALTDETGTGVVVFSNSPTLVAPTLGAALATSLRLSNAGLLDNNGNTILDFNAVGSAVNFLRLQNNIATGSPIMSAVGADTNIGFQITGKGTSGVYIAGQQTGLTPAGYRGEVVSSALLAASGVAMTTSIPRNIIASFQVQPGSWLVMGVVSLAGSSNITQGIAWCSLTSATLPDNSIRSGMSSAATSQYNITTPPLIVNNATGAAQTVYLSGYATFGSGSVAGSGYIVAIRL
jgi:hypothetical protein